MNKEDIKYIVNGIFEKANSKNLQDILDELDIKIMYTEEGLKNGYALYLRGANRETIFLDPSCPEELKDFVIAHEIGHAVLHDDTMMSFSSLGGKKKYFRTWGRLFCILFTWSRNWAYRRLHSWKLF